MADGVGMAPGRARSEAVIQQTQLGGRLDLPTGGEQIHRAAADTSLDRCIGPRERHPYRKVGAQSYEPTAILAKAVGLPKGLLNTIPGRCRGGRRLAVRAGSTVARGRV